MCDSCKPETTREILAYMAENPDAQDTFEGIVEWWLLEQNIKDRAADVKEALGELVASEFVLERKGEDSRSHYRINRRKLKKIRSLLKKKKPDALRG